MLRFFFKLLIITSFMLTYTNASTSTKNKTIQDELTNIKIELSNIKLTQKYENRDNKIKEIEQSIKGLEDRLNKNNIDKKSIEKDFQKYDEIIKRQDERISDINSNVSADITLYTSIIGLFILLVSYFSYKVSSRESEETLKQWIDKKADEKFKPKVDEYLTQIQENGERLLQELEKKANEQRNEHNNIFKDKLEEIDLANKTLSKEAKEKNDSDVKNLEKTHKDESEYTFKDWYSKFVQKYFESDYKKALEYIDRSLKTKMNEFEESQAVFAKALTLGELDRSEEAIVEYDKLIDRFSQSENEKLLEHVAKALINKGNALGRLDKNEEVIAEYDKVIDRFSKSKSERILEQVAKALVNKGFRLGKLGKSEEAIAQYDKVIDRFSNSENESLLEAVAKALVNKGFRLGKLGKSEEAIAEHDKVIDRFSKSKNENLLETVANALGNKIELMMMASQDVLDDIKFYKKLFSKNINKMMKISMLEILNNAQKSDQDKALQEWKEIYKEQSLGDWGFDELDEWNESISDETVKQRVKKYIDEFKSFKEK